jgi:hypothetical protein
MPEDGLDDGGPVFVLDHDSPEWLEPRPAIGTTL